MPLNLTTTPHTASTAILPPPCTPPFWPCHHRLSCRRHHLRTAAAKQADNEPGWFQNLVDSFLGQQKENSKPVRIRVLCGLRINCIFQEDALKRGGGDSVGPISTSDDNNPSSSAAADKDAATHTTSAAADSPPTTTPSAADAPTTPSAADAATQTQTQATPSAPPQSDWSNSSVDDATWKTNNSPPLNSGLDSVAYIALLTGAGVVAGSMFRSVATRRRAMVTQPSALAAATPIAPSPPNDALSMSWDEPAHPPSVAHLPEPHYIDLNALAAVEADREAVLKEAISKEEDEPPMQDDDTTMQQNVALQDTTLRSVPLPPTAIHPDDESALPMDATLSGLQARLVAAAKAARATADAAERASGYATAAMSAASKASEAATTASMAVLR